MVCSILESLYYRRAAEILQARQAYVTNLIFITVDSTYQNMPCIVATVESMKVTVTSENSTNQSPTASFGLGNSFHAVGSPQTNCSIEHVKTILIQIRIVIILNRQVRGS